MQLFGCFGEVNISIMDGTAGITKDTDKFGAFYGRTRKDSMPLVKFAIKNIPNMSKTSKRITSLLGLGIDKLPRT